MNPNVVEAAGRVLTTPRPDEIVDRTEGIQQFDAIMTYYVPKPSSDSTMRSHPHERHAALCKRRRFHNAELIPFWIAHDDMAAGEDAGDAGTELF